MPPKGESSGDVKHEESKEIERNKVFEKDSLLELEAELKDIPDITAGFMQQFSLAVS